MSKRQSATGCISWKARVSATLASCLIEIGLIVISSAPSRADDIRLVETGSTLFYPVFNMWASEYGTTHMGVNVTTTASGSEAGIKDAISGAAQIGASDAYMSDSESRQNPGIINIAMAISAQTVNYNLPGLNSAHLKIDGPTLAGIYQGKIRTWDDRAIAILNPDLKLPNATIAPIRRAEGSGDTFVFTQYLTFSTSSWERSPGFGTSIAWPPVPGELEATGNEGMVEKIKQTPNSIGYIGVSSFAGIAKAELGAAALKSYDGEFLLPTPESIAAAAAALGPRTPADQRLTLVNAPGANAYPLINYEYAVVSTRQPNPEIAAALRRFLLWASAPDEANAKLLADAHFIALPAHIWVMSYDQIQLIK